MLRYLKNTGWLAVEQILRLISGLVVGIWVARYLGPQQFGIYSYVIAVCSIFSGFARFGLDGVLVRELVNPSDKTSQLLGTAFWLKVAGALIAIFLLIILIWISDPNLEIGLYILIIAVGFLFQSFEVVEFYFHAQVLGRVISICKLIQLLLSSILKLFLVLYNAELIYFVSVALFDVFILSITYWVAFKIKVKIPYLKSFNNKLAVKLIRDSWPLMFTTMVIITYMKIDQIMIKQQLTEFDVGIYSVAVKVSEAAHFLPMVICSSLFPAILRAKGSNQFLYNQRLLDLYRLMVFLAIVISLPLLIFAESIIYYTFGPSYELASSVLKVHACSIIFVFLGVASSKYLLAENLTKVTFVRSTFGLISNVLLNYLLIPIYGVIGAAFATLISQGIVVFGYDFFDLRMKKQMEIKLFALLSPWKIIFTLVSK